jgi:signal transduction histidine kinase
VTQVVAPDVVRWRLRPAVAAWVLAALSVSMAAAAVTVVVAWSLDRSALGYAVVTAALCPVVGALVVARQPRNPVGWLLIAVGLFEAGAVLAGPWATVALDVERGALPAGQLAAWLGDWLWIPAHGLLVTFLLLVFPDGRLPSRRWRVVAAFAAVALLVQVAAPMTVLSQLHVRTSFGEPYPDERLATLLGSLGYRLVLVAAVASLTGLAWRLARMPAGERGPFLWFAGGAAVAVLLLLPLNLITDPQIRQVVQLAVVVSLPTGALVAIVRHRTYGIDVVLNRTLVYATLSAVLVGVYLVAAALVQLLADGAGRLSTVVAAGATALVLTPARSRLQGLANRLMYGQRNDVHQVVATIGDQFEAIAGTDDALSGVVGEIASSLRLPHVALETAGPAPTVLATTGHPTPLAEKMPLHANGELVGHLVAAPRRGQARLTERDRSALRQIGRVAATAVRQIQLTDELHRARERLAGDLEEERRRIRRDLHDGLGPTLATIVMGLEETKAVHRDDPQRADALLGDLKQQTREAIGGVRSLVYGLRPPALDDLGLLEAVRQTASATGARSGLVVELDAPAQLPELGAATEVAAYRIVHEALTNVVRHAGASRAEVTIRCTPGELCVGVTDDGRGLPDDLVAGVGLTSMRERLHDIGGRLTLRSDGGTIVHAALPRGRPCRD